jgi:hypothetical protein
MSVALNHLGIANKTQKEQSTVRNWLGMFVCSKHYEAAGNRNSRQKEITRLLAKRASSLTNFKATY